MGHSVNSEDVSPLNATYPTLFGCVLVRTVTQSLYRASIAVNEEPYSMPDA